MNLPLEGLNDGLVQIVEDSLDGGLLDKYYNVREGGRERGRERDECAHVHQIMGWIA